MQRDGRSKNQRIIKGYNAGDKSMSSELQTANMSARTFLGAVAILSPFKILAAIVTAREATTKEPAEIQEA